MNNLNKDFDREIKVEYYMKQLLLSLSLSLAVLLFASPASAQRRCVILFDCTGSMIEPNNCWDLAQGTLKDLVNNICDDNTEIVVIPYQDQDHLLKIEEGTKQQFQNDESKFKSIFANIKKPHNGTCMITALEIAGKYIDPSYYNIVCLITDGYEELCSKKKGIYHSQDDLMRVFQEWCGKYGECVQNYYIPLSNVAMAPSFLDMLKNTCFHPVDPTKPFGNFKETHISINTEEINNNVVKKINFTRTDSMTIKILNDNPFFDVEIEGNHVCDGCAQIAIKMKNGLTSEIIRSQLDEEITNDTYSFMIQFSSDEVDFGEKNYMYIDVLFKLETILSFPEDVSLIDFKRSRCYSSFLFVDKKMPDTLTYTLFSHFNDEAIRKSAFAKFRLVEKDAVNYQLLVNDEVSNNKEFVLTADDKNPCELKIVFASDNTDGTKKFDIIALSGSNIDKITGHTQFDSPQSYRIPVKAKFDVDRNPLMLALIWLTIILVSYVLLRMIVIRPIRYPKFGAIQKTIIVPGMAPLVVRFKGARMVVLSATPQKKQSAWDCFWNGKILYKIHPAFTTPIYLKPSRGKRILAKSQTGVYRILPNPIPGIGSASIDIIQTNQHILIN